MSRDIIYLLFHLLFISFGGLTDGLSQVRPPRDVVGDFFPWLLVQASRWLTLAASF
jgi:hypothetical protein